MESLEGFLMARPSRKITFFTTYIPNFQGLSRWDGLWVDSNMGAGVIIGVVDSGITPRHASFMDDSSMPPPPTKWKGTCGFSNKTFCNNKLIGAISFDDPHADPNDHKGHGTHVAGIAAGNFVANASVLGLAKGTASGVAPKAHLAIYSWGHTLAAIAAAIDRAIQDGVDILSLSLGHGTHLFADDDFAIATFGAVKKNIFVSIATGNSGPFRETVENGAPWQLTVGASNHDRRIVATVRLGNGVELEGQSRYQPSTSHTTTRVPCLPRARRSQWHFRLQAKLF
ncbi:subtilisin-like protease [Dioscorea cayenensis subsp. rotundata]|uniref:Subtilisin-like protease n=1 Tax=Dioscorea cayennensis subsp. rotundata TaxID=55577 RepID=A0AB40CEA8_DIOCR|nr:subtilisin-like protease [Dioscorea cayenensis subsp. rotundata]